MMSARSHLLALLLSALPVAAGAQSPPDRCRELLRQSPISVPDATSEATGPDDCRFTHVRIRFTPIIGYAADSVTEHGIPATRPSPDQKRDMQLQANGVVLVLNTGNKMTSLLNRLQQVPYDISADVSVDPDQDRAEIRKLTMDGYSIGHIALSATITPIKTEPENAALASLHLHFDSRSFLGMFAVPFLVPQLPQDDPQAAYDQIKTRVVAEIRALLPVTGASAQTIDAVASFAEDFPHPRHVLDLSLESSPPATIVDVMAAAGDPASVTALLHRLTVTATYTGDPH